MASKVRTLIRLNAPDGSGHFYTTSINPRTMKVEGEGKLKIKKYNPVAREHQLYMQGKIK